MNKIRWPTVVLFVWVVVLSVRHGCLAQVSSCGTTGGVEERIADCTKVYGDKATRTYEFKVRSSDPLDADDKVQWKLVTRTSDGKQVWRDQASGLIWGDSTGEKWKWSAALSGCQIAARGGFDVTGGLRIDWRLPTRAEYETALDHGIAKVLLGMQVEDRQFWSSTLKERYRDVYENYFVLLCHPSGGKGGFIHYDRADSENYFRCVATSKEAQAGSTPSPPSSGPAAAAAKAGHELLEAGKYEEAIVQLNEAIRLDRNNTKAYINRAHAYSLLNKSEQAIEDLSEAIRLSPHNADLYALRAHSYVKLGKYEPAIENCSETIRLDPANSLAYQIRGYANFHLGKFDTAIEDYNQALKLKPGFAEAYIGRGQVYKDLGKYEQAIGDLNEAIRLNPRYAEPYFYRAFAYHSLGKAEQAIADYNEAIKLNPRYAESYFYRGFAYYGLGKAEQAIEDYNESIKADPRHISFFYRSLAYITLARGTLASADARFYLDRAGWKTSRSQYMVLVAFLGYCRDRNDTEVTKLLAEAATKCDTSAWPYAIIRYLRREITDTELLKMATDNNKMTEVQTYMGLALSIAGNRQEALRRLNWVKTNGNQNANEYPLALAEAERLAR
jgi:tetratricopeptide (TPR) repeat protein